MLGRLGDITGYGIVADCISSAPANGMVQWCLSTWGNRSGDNSCLLAWAADAGFPKRGLLVSFSLVSSPCPCRILPEHVRKPWIFKLPSWL
jgi:hypothetical protein